MDLYIVSPNLKIQNCEDCPSHDVLVSAKHKYLCLIHKSQSMYDSLVEKPDWCKPRDNINEKNSMPPLVSIILNNDDIPSTSNVPSNSSSKSFNNDFNRLNIPKSFFENNNNNNNNKIIDKNLIDQLTLKYIYILTDLSYLKYKYLKSHIKINNLIKSNFTNKVVSEKEELDAINRISLETEKFHGLEFIIMRLVHLQKVFQSHFQPLIDQIQVCNIKEKKEEAKAKEIEGNASN